MDKLYGDLIMCIIKDFKKFFLRSLHFLLLKREAYLTSMEGHTSVATA